MPRITGRRLIRLLLNDGWEDVRGAAHGRWLRKVDGDRVRFTTVKDTREIIPQTTLGQILGPKQTGLGSAGLRRLLGN